jgi:uncharacterized damage-inducible protein DinB
MDLAPATAARYLQLGFEGLLAVAEGLGDDRANERPLGPTTNSVAALAVHCCGVAEYWLGHVGLGRASDRDRDWEFISTATIDELRARIERTLAQAWADLEALAAGEGSSVNADERTHLVDRTDAGLVLHVIEEVFQHLGHAELAADALR